MHRAVTSNAESLPIVVDRTMNFSILWRARRRRNGSLMTCTSIQNAAGIEFAADLVVVEGLSCFIPREDGGGGGIKQCLKEGAYAHINPRSSDAAASSSIASILAQTSCLDLINLAP